MAREAREGHRARDGHEGAFAMSGAREQAGEGVLNVRSPWNGEPVATVAVDGPVEVRAAVARARSAQAGWASLSPAERARHLAGLRRAMTRRADEIADRIVAETGKPQAEALTEVAVVLGLMRYYQPRAPHLLAPRRAARGWLLWKRARVVREPWGVVGVIAPWNYPFILSARPTVSALFAGNGVVLKPSEHTPLTGAFVPELLADAGLPGGLVQVVQGGAETGQALVTGGLDRLHFTGSSAVGRTVLAAAAPRLLPVTMELGGKDPALVLADADLDRAAAGITFGGFYNAGQTCASIERVYVVESVYEAFLRRLVRAASNLQAGTGGRADVGPMTLPRGLELVEAQLADAQELGARVLCGGHRLDPASSVFLPTVLADVTDRMRVMREESFGPLLPVMAVADVDEAVARANAHPKGLSASVWTGDRAQGRAVAARLRCGSVTVNDVLSEWGAPGVPLGGVGESGFGRSGGDEGLLAFTRTRAVVEDLAGLKRDPWWFPYERRVARVVRAAIAWSGEDGIRRVSRALGALLGRGEH